ncbi:hypothetical protein [Actinoplanes philippinensis]|uniref:hypothetical protein n=1 Tax=Actinoplanes philippinensis TaxID=35752 RepID=UPI003404ABC1
MSVDTAAGLLSSIATPGPLTNCVAGTITAPAGMYDVTSDKSIVGVGSTAGITGGGLTIGLPVSAVTTPPANAVHNVIIQNLSFRNATDDSMNVQMDLRRTGRPLRGPRQRLRRRVGRAGLQRNSAGAVHLLRLHPRRPGPGQVDRHRRRRRGEALMIHGLGSNTTITGGGSDFYRT